MRIAPVLLISRSPCLLNFKMFLRRGNTRKGSMPNIEVKLQNEWRLAIKAALRARPVDIPMALRAMVGTFAAGESWNPVLELHQPLRFCKPPPELLGQWDRN